MPEGNFPSGKLKIDIYKRRKLHEYHSNYYLDSIVVGRVAGMALQPQLGIWRKRDRWVPSASGNPGPVIQLVLANVQNQLLDLGVAVCQRYS